MAQSGPPTAPACVCCPCDPTAARRRTCRAWRAYQTARPTPADMRAFRFEQRDGFGAVAGPVSQTECWDFDCPGDVRGVRQRPPTAMRARCHVAARLRDWLRRSDARVAAAAGSCKLSRHDRVARLHTGAPAAAGRRAAGAEGADTHRAADLQHLGAEQWRDASEQPAYVHISGDFTTIAEYDADERDALIALARSFDSDATA